MLYPVASHVDLQRINITVNNLLVVVFVAGAAAGLTADVGVTAGLDGTTALGAAAALPAPRPAGDVPAPSHTTHNHHHHCQMSQPHVIRKCCQQ